MVSCGACPLTGWPSAGAACMPCWLALALGAALAASVSAAGHSAASRHSAGVGGTEGAAGGARGTGMCTCASSECSAPHTAGATVGCTGRRSISRPSAAGLALPAGPAAGTMLRALALAAPAPTSAAASAAPTAASRAAAPIFTAAACARCAACSSRRTCLSSASLLSNSWLNWRQSRAVSERLEGAPGSDCTPTRPAAAAARCQPAAPATAPGATVLLLGRPCTGSCPEAEPREAGADSTEDPPPLAMLAARTSIRSRTACRGGSR